MSARLVPGRRAEDFLWATGIEDTFVPQTRPGHRALDEYQLMSHYQHWREDLALVGDLGLRAVRWGVPWYRVEPFQPGEFDWRWTDQVLPYLVEELGADVNARDLNGYSPLHHVAARGDNELILYLVEKGADVTVVSRRGQTTADMANGPVQRISPFPETVALLEKLGAKNNHRCMSC